MTCYIARHYCMMHENNKLYRTIDRTVTTSTYKCNSIESIEFDLSVG